MAAKVSGKALPISFTKAGVNYSYSTTLVTKMHAAYNRILCFEDARPRGMAGFDIRTYWYEVDWNECALFLRVLQGWLTLSAFLVWWVEQYIYIAQLSFVRAYPWQPGLLCFFVVAFLYFPQVCHQAIAWISYMGFCRAPEINVRMTRPARRYSTVALQKGLDCEHM